LLVRLVLALEVEHFDGLDNRGNALALLGEPGAAYGHHHPPASALVQLPAMALRRLGWLDDPHLWPHLSAFAVSLVGLGLGWRLGREAAGPLAAGAAVALLAWNRLFLHYAPLTVSFGPTLAAVGLALLLTVRARSLPSPRSAVFAGLAVAAACLTRYQCLALGPAVVAFWLLPDRERRPRAWRSLGILSLTAFVTWTGTYALIDWVVGAEGPWAGTPLAGVGAALETLGRTGEVGGVLLHRGGPLFFLELWPLAGGWVGTGLAVVGAGAALRGRRPLDVLVLVWVGVYLVAHAVVAHAEARYAAPLLPAAAYLWARGVPKVAGAARRLPAWGRWALLLGALLGAVEAPAVGAREVSRWTDPAYRSDFGPRLAGELKALRGEGADVFWVGSFAAIYPAEVVLHPDDPFHGLFHLGAKGLGYYLREPVWGLRADPGQPLGPQLLGLPAGSAVAAVEDAPLTWNRPPQPPPVRLFRVLRRPLPLASEGSVAVRAADGVLTYRVRAPWSGAFVVRAGRSLGGPLRPGEALEIPEGLVEGAELLGWEERAFVPVVTQRAP
jgi:hypothetical protein